jgi:hypothetical protein
MKLNRKLNRVSASHNQWRNKMASLKLLSAALFAAAVVAAPAMARQHHVRHVANDAAVVTTPDPAYGALYANGGYRCVPAPRVGAFAGAPWELSVPCEPAYGPVQAY